MSWYPDVIFPVSNPSAHARKKQSVSDGRLEKEIKACNECKSVCWCYYPCGVDLESDVSVKIDPPLNTPASHQSPLLSSPAPPISTKWWYYLLLIQMRTVTLSSVSPHKLNHCSATKANHSCLQYHPVNESSRWWDIPTDVYLYISISISLRKRK